MWRQTSGKATKEISRQSEYYRGNNEVSTQVSKRDPVKSKRCRGADELPTKMYCKSRAPVFKACSNGWQTSRRVVKKATKEALRQSEYYRGNNEVSTQASKTRVPNLKACSIGWAYVEERLKEGNEGSIRQSEYYRGNNEVSTQAYANTSRKG